jgi:hypothetical protein
MATMTVPDPLVAFINARLDEEEADARSATPGPWWVENTTSRRWTVMAAADDAPERAQMVGGGNSVRRCGDADTRHIARQDPAVTLARVTELRALLVWATADYQELSADPGVPVANITAEAAQTTVLYHLAAACRYRPDGTQHPDWQEEWTANV